MARDRPCLILEEEPRNLATIAENRYPCQSRLHLCRLSFVNFAFWLNKSSNNGIHKHGVAAAGANDGDHRNNWTSYQQIAATKFTQLEG